MSTDSLSVEEKVEQLVQLMQARRTLMKQVAQYKLAHHQAVTDAKREHAIERWILSVCPTICAQVILSFFDQLIELCRREQEQQLLLYKQQNIIFSKDDVADLHEVLRPKISEIDNQILIVLLQLLRDEHFQNQCIPSDSRTNRPSDILDIITQFLQEAHHKGRGNELGSRD